MAAARARGWPRRPRAASRPPPSSRASARSEMRVATLITDDEPVARAGLRAMLRPLEWIEIVGEAADGPSAVEAIDRLRPELVLLDVQMPGLLGTDVLQRVTHQPY